MSRLPQLLLLILIAAALRLWQIDQLPPGFHFDEAFEGVEAWRILTEPGYRPVFLTGNFGVPPLNAYSNALTFALFQQFGGEAGPTAMRVTAAFYGVLGVVLVYALAVELRKLEEPRDAFSPAFPLLAAGSLALMRWHIHFSRMGIEPVIVPVIWTGAFWLLLRGWRTGAWWAFGGSGIFLAAGMYTYQGAWIIPFLVVLTSGHLLLDAWLTRREDSAANAPTLAQRGMGLALAAIVAALLFAPLGLFFLEQPDLLLARPTQLSIVGATTSPGDATVEQTVWATAQMFGPFGQPGDLDPRRNIPGAATLNVWQVIPFYLGILLALWHIRRPAYALVLVGLVGLLLPGVFSEYAPHFHRILGAAAPTALLCGIGLDFLWRLASDRVRLPVMLRYGLYGGVILLVVAGGMIAARNYFVRWAAQSDLYYAFDAGLWEMGQWVAEQQLGNPIYVTPRGEDHSTLAFAWRTQPTNRTTTMPPMPISFDGRHVFPLSRGVTGSDEHYVVVEHEDFRTRLLLPEVLSAALVEREFLDDEGQVYGRIYTRPAGSEAQRPPMVSRETLLGDGIALVGYDVLPAELHPSETLYLQLHWLTDAMPTQEWTVFTHVVDPADGTVVAGWDSLPGQGSLPTTAWQPGWRILDEYQIALPADLPPGEYLLRTGLYGADGATLPVDGSGVDLETVEISARQ